MTSWGSSEREVAERKLRRLIRWHDDLLARTLAIVQETQRAGHIDVRDAADLTAGAQEAHDSAVKLIAGIWPGTGA